MKNNIVSVKEMLKEFTNSYMKKESNLPEFKLGFKIKENKWYYVHIKRDNTFEIIEGKPKEPILYFETDIPTLLKIYNQDMTAATAMGKAWEYDSAPLELRVMEGIKIPEGLDPYNIIFRYFLLGELEKIKLGKEHARIVHDGYAIPLLYTKGLRTAWYRIDKGMKMNEKENDQTNLFNKLIVVTRGKGIAKIGEDEISISEREAYFIPKNVSNMLWTNEDEGLEFNIIMYGEEV